MVHNMQWIYARINCSITDCSKFVTGYKKKKTTSCKTRFFGHFSNYRVSPSQGISLVPRPSLFRNAGCIASPARGRVWKLLHAVFVCSRGICIEPMGCELSCDIAISNRRHACRIVFAECAKNLRPLADVSVGPLKSITTSTRQLRRWVYSTRGAIEARRSHSWFSQM